MSDFMQTEIRSSVHRMACRNVKEEHTDSYEEAVSYIMDIPRFNGKNTLEDTRCFYEYMNCPGSTTSVIHIAGTNGKGSVCAFLNGVLQQMGKRTAMFVSPHLVDIRERIRIQDQLISKADFTDAFLQVCKQAERFSCEKEKEYHPSFFEFLFFMAMLYFEKEQPDYILLETGLGGRLDATNVIESPKICIITEIGFDHMEYLGNTLEEIASQKAGIIKKNIPVVFWDKCTKTSKVIENFAEKMHAPCIKVSKENGNLKAIHDKDIDFSYRSLYYKDVDLKIPSKAVYQADNAILALTALETIFTKEELSPLILQQGIGKMHWEGRMEEIGRRLVVDGAHNVDGCEAFLSSVSLLPMQGRRLLFCAVSDKQIEQMAKMIEESGLFKEIITAPIQSERSMNLVQLEQLFKAKQEIGVFASVPDALQHLFSESDQGDIIYCTGSLYLVGQIKQYMENRTFRNEEL